MKATGPTSRADSETYYKGRRKLIEWENPPQWLRDYLELTAAS